jgi:hypothetical protein
MQSEINQIDPASETNRENRMWQGYSFPPDLQSTGSRVLLKNI